MEPSAGPEENSENPVHEVASALHYIIWDWENKSIRSNINLDKVISGLIALLVSYNCKGIVAIEVVVGTFDDTRILEKVRFGLMAKGITVFQANCTKKDSADAAIVSRVKNWFESGLQSRMQSGYVVFISSDHFYGPISQKINKHFNTILLYDEGMIRDNLVHYPGSSCLEFSSILNDGPRLENIGEQADGQRLENIGEKADGQRLENIGEQAAKTALLSTRQPFLPVCEAVSVDLVWAPFDENSYETDWQFTDPVLGPDEAVITNIEACKKLSTFTRTYLGPNGMKVINHLDTNDAATTTVNEHEIQHPAAKLLVLAAKAQQEEIRDGANLTISFAGELLQNAEKLIRMGFNPSEITSGYSKAFIKAVEILEQLVETMDVRDKDEVISRMRAAVASKQFGQICSLVADACIQVCPNDPTNFNVDNVRVAKRLGGDLQNSCIKPGMVLESDVVGRIKRMEKAKVAVFADGVDTTATETTGTEQRNYAEAVEELIKAGAKVIVSGGSIGEKALHFCDNHGIMVLKISSGLELTRFCQTAGAVAHLKLSRPSPDNLGYVDSISVEDIGGVTVTIARNEEDDNSIYTVVLRGSTDSILDDLERAVDDGVHTYKAMCRDSRIVPGAAATEMELAQSLKDYANAEIGLDKYAISKYAESFGFVPKTLAGNAGLNVKNVKYIINALYTGHRSGNTKLGIDLEKGVCKDVSETKVWDLFSTKLSALKCASDAACNVLRLDQNINGPEDL